MTRTPRQWLTHALRISDADVDRLQLSAWQMDELANILSCNPLLNPPRTRKSHSLVTRCKRCAIRFRQEYTTRRFQYCGLCRKDR